MALTRTVNMSTHDALFKEFYAGSGSTSLVNAKTPLASILMKNKSVDFVGDSFVAPVRFGSAVGLGYRAVGTNLPSPVPSPRGKATFPAKRAYGTVSYDREAIVASRNDRGAFAKVTVDETEALIEGFMLHNVERCLFGDGSGKLGAVASVSGSGTEGSPWVVVGETTGVNGPKHKKRYYPKGAKVDLYTTGGVFQLTARVVGATSTTVSLVLVSTGSVAAPVAADVIYWEGNRNGEITGLKSLVSSGTIYGINNAVDTEFKGLSETISGALQIDDLNDAVSDLEEESDSPNMAICSHAALAALKNQMEDQKRYEQASVKSSDGKIGFAGIMIMSDSGAFPLVASQMCPSDELYLFNTKCMQLVMRQDFGFFDDDGQILLRDTNKDEYNARYGGYYEFFCSKPNTVKLLSGFTL